MGKNNAKQAYRTGQGKVIVRCRRPRLKNPSRGKQQIIVTEIPYQVNKARLIEKIADLVKEKRARRYFRISATSPTEKVCA